jgi:hypothetical protein
MTSVFLISLSQQLFLVIVGLSLLQLVFYQNRLAITSNLPYAWGIGVVFLYIVGFILVRFALAPKSWHWIVLTIGIMIILFAGYFYLASEKTDIATWQWQLKWYDWLLFFLILIKLTLVLYSNLVNPVVDSDATNNYRHIGLAKYIAMGYPLSETMAYKGGQSTMLSPPVLHSWLNMFQERWHDSVATMSCFFAYLSIIGITFVAAFKTTAKITPALISAYIISTIPLLNIHVIRAGYADILVSLFFAMGVSVLALTLNRIDNINKSHLFLLTIAFIGAAMTKMEGTIWLGILIFFFIGVYAHHKNHFSWNKILIVQMGLIIVCFISYLISADWILKNVDMSLRLSWLFQKSYDPESFDMFFGFMYTWGAFGLFWWLLSILSFILLLTGKYAEARICVLYTFIFLAALFYFANFTGNVRHTISGTDVGRFLLQISTIFILVYTAFIKNIIHDQQIKKS